MKEFKIVLNNEESSKDLQSDLNCFFAECNLLITVDIDDDIMSIKVCKDENEYQFYCGNISEETFLENKNIEE